MTGSSHPPSHRVPLLRSNVVVALLVLLGAATARSDTGAVEITLENWAPYYQPAQTVIQPGITVRWINQTASPHTIRHDGCQNDGPCAFDSGPIFPDQSFSLLPHVPGRYPYHCELHPVMRGILIVDASQTRGTAPKGEE